MDTKKRNNNRSKSIASKGFTLICVAVFLYSLYVLGGIGLDYYHNSKVLAEAQDLYDVSFTQTENSNKVREQFDELHEINEDIVGWIAIDDTKINYPVLQAPDNDYYLDKNYKRDETRAGSIFMDYRNDVAFSSLNTILYGHNMRDGSMFRHLNKFLDEAFYQDHPQIFFDTLYESFDAEVFSVYYTTTAFDYIQTDFSSLGEYAVFLEELEAKSKFKSDVQVDETDKIITLSTCDYTLDPNEGRLVVHAKLVERN